MFSIHQYYTCAVSCCSSGSLPLSSHKWWGRGNLHGNLGSTNSSWLCRVHHQNNLPRKFFFAQFLPQIWVQEPKAKPWEREQQSISSPFPKGQPWNPSRDHRSSPGCTSLPSQGHPRAQDCSQTGLEYLQWGDSTPSAVSNISCTNYSTHLSGSLLREGGLSLREVWKWKEKWAIIHVM